MANANKPTARYAEQVRFMENSKRWDRGGEPGQRYGYRRIKGAVIKIMPRQHRLNQPLRKPSFTRNCCREKMPSAATIKSFIFRHQARMLKPSSPAFFPNPLPRKLIH